METPSLSHLSIEDYDNVYEPAEDSFLLIDALEQDLKYLRSLNPSVCVEVGSGSGVVITAVAKALGRSSYYVAVDINPIACNITQQTVQHNNTEVGVVAMDLMSAFHWNNKIDVLIFNPPYVVTPSEEVEGKGVHGDLARAWAGGERGRQIMDRLLDKIPRLLSECGVFYLVAIAENCPEDIRLAMNLLGFNMHIVKERKVRGEHLFVLKFTRT